MEVKIGVQYAARELVVETDASNDDIQKAVSEAVSSDGVLSLTDAKGRTVVVPAAKIAYVEIGTSAGGTVGFRS